MKLDCIKTEAGEWQVIDYDNSCKQISISNDAEGAWYFAAMKLEIMINEASEKLKT